MRKYDIKFLGTLFSLFTVHVCYAQEKGVSTVDSLDKAYLNWYNLDPVTDKVQGAAINRAYTEILKNKTPRKKIIIALIDGGVDINHKDLAGKIWINKDEIPENGIDDDNNGYVDDINGWNYIGNSKGENIEYENLEYVRIFKKLDPTYKDVRNADNLSSSEQEEYTLYMNCKEQYEKELKKYTEREKLLISFEAYYHIADSIIKSYLNKEEYSKTELEMIKSAPEDAEQARAYFLHLYKSGFTIQIFNEMKKNTMSYLDYRLNTAYDPRTLISDNPEDIKDSNYGNNNVIGPAADHGTFVAGIIAANRDNNIGTDGIAENVEIMVLRAIPDGDERDKDVALAVRYAVNNGANIINMSFGKDYSPQKLFVDDAIRYADERNVMIIHAAGNDAEDLDEKERYPTNNLNEGTEAKNWLAVGASTHKLTKNFCGIFSNFGQNKVDLFAPGVNIISLYPENTYMMNDGTSFSCPVVSGVAALVWSYYPELTALQLKEILLSSTTRYPRKKVYYPNIQTSAKSKTRFSMLSKTGGIINAYEALKSAENFILYLSNLTQRETNILSNVQ